MVHIQHFEFSVLVSCIEYQIPVVLPLQAVGADVIRLGIPYGIVPAPVLQHYSLDLLRRVGYSQIAIFHVQTYLLMLFVDINIRVGRISDGYLYLRIYHHEAGCQHPVVITIGIIIVNREFIVSAHGNATVLVWDGELIMGVEMVGVERLLYVVDGLLAIEAPQIVGFKESLRYLPVGIAMFYLVGIAMVVVGHVVEIDVDRETAQLGDRHGLPVGARHYLQGGDAWVEYLVALRMSR